VSPLLLLLAVLPGLIISYVIFRMDKYEHEPLMPMLLCFAMGALATVPAVFLERMAFEWVGYDGRQGLAATLFLAFLAIAANEELLKFLVLLAAAFPRRFFNEPLDGIVYAVLVAMGFATAENIGYAGRFGMDTVILRSLTAVPAHLVFAIVQGYYVGLARFQPERKRTLLWRGLLLAILLHGVYDLLIMQMWTDWLFVLATISIYMSLYYFSSFIKEHQDNSPFRPGNPRKKDEDQ
jgi:protease PrsW